MCCALATISVIVLRRRRKYKHRSLWSSEVLLKKERAALTLVSYLVITLPHCLDQTNMAGFETGPSAPLSLPVTIQSDGPADLALAFRREHPC